MSRDLTILGLDVGEARTGVAISRPPVHIPRPLVTLPFEDLIKSVTALVADEDVGLIVVGLPRNMSSESTPQTARVQTIVEQLKQTIHVPIRFTDEAVTSVKAKNELEARKRPYKKEDVDMLAATYILEDYIAEHPEIIYV